MEYNEVETFADTLQKYGAKKPTKLYNGNENLQSEFQNQNCEIQDVISNISKQVQAIQSADKMNNRLNKQKILNNHKINGFQTVNAIPIVQTSDAHKFETQCEFDTQIINYIEGVEALLEKPKDIDKEFETTFYNSKNNEENLSISVNRQEIQLGDDNIMKNETTQCKNIVTKPSQLIDVSNNKKDGILNNFDDEIEERNVNKTNLETECEVKNVLNDAEKPKSLLVYNLDKFEQFENIALPLINDSLDFETAKKIVNSQIINRELFINSHTEPVLSDRDKTPSPILGKSTKIHKKVNTNINIEDEIIFSDDDFEDLPLTCALETSFYKQNDDLDKTMFVGFQTASDKSIQVHTKSYSKAKSILNDISVSKLVEVMDKANSIPDEVNICKITNDLELGCKTANQKDINNINESFETKTEYKDILDCNSNDEKFTLKSKKNVKLPESKLTHEKSFECNYLYNMESLQIDDCIMKEFENNFLADNLKVNDNNSKSLNKQEQSKYNDFPFEGFKPASNNVIKISDQGLARTCNIFEDIDFSDLKSNDDKENWQNFDNCEISKPSTSKFVGFKTGNDKIIKISEQALAKTKKIFENIDQVILPNKQVNDKANISIEKAFKVDNRNHNKFNKYDGNDEYFKSPIVKASPNKSKGKDKLNMAFTGFKTASNKAVDISKAALAKSEKLFKELLNDESKFTLNKNPDTTYKENVTNVPNIGFKTASNKIVKISKQALEKSKKIFQEIATSQSENLINNNNAEKKIIGFKTASNKPVLISEEALVKSKVLFKDIDDTKEANNINGIVDLKCGRVENGFRTGDNNPENIRNKDVENDGFGQIKVRSNVFEGFKTASNKDVKVSEEALAKTKNLFQDLDLDKNDINTDMQFVGFQTANNKKVKISKEALLKSKKMFENIDSNENKTFERDKMEIEEKIDVKTANNRNGKISEDWPGKNKQLFPKNYETKSKTDVILNMDDLIINTELIKDLEESFSTDDFKKTPISKRSGSPILSCPKAKKRKFKTPQLTTKTIINNITETVKSTNIIKFSDNYKKNKKYSLKNIKEIDSNPANIDFDFKYTFETLLQFEFRGKRNDIDSDVWSTDRIKQTFTDAVNKKIIPDGWLDNHLKLIIWKLISYEVFFPNCMKDVCSVQNVLNQLKYRYDRELYNVERPILRKILEKDVVASKLMVLCVVSFYVNGVSICSVANKTQNIEMLLTDGWYCVKACTDRMIDDLICSGRIRVGTKLAIHGAELVNCEQGVAPWEDTSSIRLKLSGNSIRRSRWDTRLGSHGNAAILSPLPAVRVEGGKVSRMRIYVTRVYPMLYVEKFDDGSTVTRSERLEYIHQMKFETDRQNAMEKLYEEVEKMAEQESQDSEPLDSERNLDTGSQIYRAMKKSRDVTDFRVGLTDTQTDLLQAHTNKQRDRILDNLQKKLQELVKSRGLDANRNVVGMLRVRGVGGGAGGGGVCTAVITIWRPAEDLLAVLQEGSWVDVYSVVPTAVRSSELQISAGRQSIFRKSKMNKNNLESFTDKFKRQCYHIKELSTNNINEIDTAGLVFLIEQTNNQFQNVYLADENKNILCINFWGGIKKFGFENIINIGEVISCVNLQKRAGNTKIPQYRVTEFSYFTKSCKIGIIKKHTDELMVTLSKIDRKKFIADCIAIKNNFDILKTGKNVTPYRLNNSDYNISKNKIFIDSPANNVRLESTSKQTDKQESPNSKKRREISEKIAKLKKYGEPPPLNLIHIKNSTITPYKSPIINVTSIKTLPQNSNDISSNVAISESSSPLLNKTYVKCINPVKLNFSKDFDDTELEDFDYSPPLSLD